MRVLLVGSGYPPQSRGGTELHMHALALALMARGHQVEVFCRRGEGSAAEYAEESEVFEGVPVHRINNLFSRATRLELLFDDPEIDAAFNRHVDRFAPDLVHIHHLTGLSTGILDRAEKLHLPVVMTLHDFWMVCPRGQRITPELEICHDLDRRRCAPCLDRLWPHFGITPDLLRESDTRLRRRMLAADRLIAPSAFHRERMLEAELDPERLRVIRHGMDASRLPAREAVRWPPQHVGYIGSVIPTKGVHVLVEAMNLLGNPRLQCHIHGEAPAFHGDGDYVERLRRLARGDLVFRFHGTYQPEALPGILRGLDLVVVPSLWWESFCLTIREALLAGVPVLASDLGAMHEALAELDEDLLFRPGDPEDLSHKIHALCQDEARYRRLSQLQDRVRSVEDMVGETEALYREVCGDPDRRRAALEELAARKRRGSDEPYATVFIPTWNGGALFEKVLDLVLAQECDFDFEVLCIDSGSRDGTALAIQRRPQVRLIEIPNSEFNHGLTRNRAVREARGEVVILLTQDAEPDDVQWLQRMVDAFDDPEVAGVYGHQVPRGDCNPFQRDRLRSWTRGEGSPERKRLGNRAAWDSLHPFERYRLIAFDNVCSGVRKSVMNEIPFMKRQFGEDVAWGRAAIQAGHTLVMEPRAAVIHSHENPMLYEFKRVYLDHQNLHDLCGLHTVPTLGAVCRCSVHAMFHLWGAVWRDDRPLPYKLWWTLKTPMYGFLQNLAQYLGARSVGQRAQGRGELLDRWLRKGV